MLRAFIGLVSPLYHSPCEPVPEALPLHCEPVLTTEQIVPSLQCAGKAGGTGQETPRTPCPEKNKSRFFPAGCRKEKVGGA